MKAVKVTPKLLVAGVEVPEVAQLIVLSCKCGTNYTLCNGLVRVWVESDKIVLKKGFSQSLACVQVETVKMARGIYSPHTIMNAVWGRGWGLENALNR